MNKLVIIPIFALVLILIDLYVFQAVKMLVQDWASYGRKSVTYLYWGLTIVSILALFTYHFVDPGKVGKSPRTFIMVGLFIAYFSKLFAVLFLFVDDVVRVGKWIVSKLSNPTGYEIGNGPPMSRSDFLSKTALIAAAVPAATLGYGIISGAHDYRIRRRQIVLPNLPSAFDGLRIGQISDIHSGSFFNKTAVKGGVDLLESEKPDVVFFTGDLVNNKAEEVKGYIDIFSKVKAPLGVYSTLGNHDYGEYVSWPSHQAKVNNLKNLMKAHSIIGWDLLMNENRLIGQNGEKLAIIGIENWGTGRWPKYGKLAEAYKGTEEASVKLLLSHDPSHWDAQVRPEYKDIDITFAGHTHGFQFGVEIGNFRWSPSQYMYKQWADIYSEGNQYLYVNRGFGYLGFPGRIGILPEITILELKKA